MAQVVLEAERLTKRFGGVAAVNAVDLAITAGELHAIIGPNGAGKTTLLNLLSGELAPDGGAIRLAGADVTRVAMHGRSARGLARTFQITSVFDELTVLENLLLASQNRLGHCFRFWRPAVDDGRVQAIAMAALEEVGLADSAALPAAILSHGERRFLELAMAIATDPQILLLDEPMAGIGAMETGFAIERLARCKRRFTIVLIEHDMDAVFALADRITVLAAGQVVATDRPDAIQANAAAQAVYLGVDGDIAGDIA